MKPFKNYENTKALSEARKLPVGAYICKVLNAEIKTYSGKNGNFDKLEISFDIAEGEYKGFYADDYKAQRQEDKKWKGVLRLYVPTDDGSEMDELNKSIFKSMTEAAEESNAGYHWDWDEAKLKGKAIGIMFRNEEWAVNGKSGWKAQPFKALSVDAVKANKFTLPKDKPLKNRPAYAAASTDLSDFEEIASGNNDLPFDI